MSTWRTRATWSSTTCGGCATSSRRRARGGSSTYLASVARLAAVNVVDAKPLHDAAAIAAGLAVAFPHVVALAAAPVLAKRRGGNVVLAGSHDPLPLDRVRARAAADSSPSALLAPEEMPAFIGGTPPWRDP